MISLFLALVALYRLFLVENLSVLFALFRLKNGLQVCAVKAPGFGDNRKNTMKDMAIASGGIIYNDEAELNKLDDVTFDGLGGADEIVITKDDTLIMKVGISRYYGVLSMLILSMASIFYVFLFV